MYVYIQVSLLLYVFHLLPFACSLLLQHMKIFIGFLMFSAFTAILRQASQRQLIPPRHANTKHSIDRATLLDGQHF